jgi:hypothetical protein
MLFQLFTGGLDFGFVLKLLRLRLYRTNRKENAPKSSTVARTVGITIAASRILIELLLIPAIEAWEAMGVFATVVMSVTGEPFGVGMLCEDWLADWDDRVELVS